jgi:peptidoglycan-associated lipoprotein
MTRIQLGRGGWVVEVGGLIRAASVALVVVSLALGGCSSKQKNAGAGAGGPGSGGIGDNGLGGAGGGSLNKFANGTMGGPNGPLSDIHFGYNDATIQPQDNEVLKSNADYLSKNAAVRVQIEGHCDDRGSEEYNIALGARRAQAAKDYLSTLGIAADRMSTISYGKELPLCTEETDDCWAQNRRDHFAVSQ